MAGDGIHDAVLIWQVMVYTMLLSELHEVRVPAGLLFYPQLATTPERGIYVTLAEAAPLASLMMGSLPKRMEENEERTRREDSEDEQFYADVMASRVGNPYAAKDAAEEMKRQAESKARDARLAQEEAERLKVEAEDIAKTEAQRREIAEASTKPQPVARARMAGLACREST